MMVPQGDLILHLSSFCANVYINVGGPCTNACLLGFQGSICPASSSMTRRGSTAGGGRPALSSATSS